MQEKKSKNREWMQYAGLATQWLVMLGLAVWAGISIDKRVGPDSRIFTISLPLLALGISFYNLIKKLNNPKK
ncbi:AtpZ/AtpI family protein [Rurimicrobium arvi]|uniref:AtpZ/AtpI family protein n=1 Tax=Rurimicrobium arvi TaxID=2049916 RepID=A0ABP8MM12_9BACT